MRLFILFISVAFFTSCEVISNSEHEVFLRNESNHKVFYTAIIEGEGFLGTIDTMSTNSFFHRTSGKVETDDISSGFSLSIFSIQGLDTIPSSEEIKLKEIFRDYRQDYPYHFYDYFYVITDSIF